MDDVDRKLSRISASRGVQLNLPITLPLKTADDFDILDDWLKSESNKTDLVSSIQNYRLKYNQFKYFVRYNVGKYNAANTFIQKIFVCR